MKKRRLWIKSFGKTNNKSFYFLLMWREKKAIFLPALQQK